MNDTSALHEPLHGQLRDVWERVVAGGQFIGGPLVEAFECEWADATSRAGCVAVGNGTEALALILRAVGIGPGDEVLVPANTFIATAEAVSLVGATPHFVDVDPRTLQVGAQDLEAGLTPRTAAAICVDLYGHMPDVESLVRFAERRGLALIEDAAQAHGARWRDRPAGSVGVASSFSFYPSKNLGAFGDAGAVVSDDAGLLERVRALADHGRRGHALHAEPGTNSRMDALQAGVLSVKLRQLEGWNTRRRELVDLYAARLGPFASSIVRGMAGTSSAWHQLVVRLPRRDVVAAALADVGVPTAVHYPRPCHRQPAYSPASACLPVAERAATEVLSLPLHPCLSDEDAGYVADRLLEALTGELPRPGRKPLTGAGRTP